MINFHVSGSFDRSCGFAALEKCSHGQLCLLCIDLDELNIFILNYS